MINTSGRFKIEILTKHYLFVYVFLCMTGSNYVQAETSLTLQNLVDLAVTNDPWIARSKALQSALTLQSEAAGELPDPQMTASLANFPTDTFSFSQEPMTQVQLGIMQKIPGGHSRKYRRRVKILQSESEQLAQLARTQLVELKVTQLWLDLYLAHSTHRLILQDRPLFQQLIEVTNASYQSASGRTNQQDVIRVQLELIQLDDRLLQLKETKTSRKQEFVEWLPASYLSLPMTWTLDDKLLAEPQQRFDDNSVNQLLTNHPDLRLIDRTIDSKKAGFSLAQESTKPDWSISASYGYRDHDRMGNDLADFVSVGVSFALPIFKKNRQHKQIAAAAELVGATESLRLIRLQQLRQRYMKSYASLKTLDERLALYRDSLLAQINVLAQASLSAYTSGQGDFSDVMRAYITLLNAKIEVKTIEVNRLKTLAEIRYLSTSQEYAS
jgi:outer membrane protein TolC